MGLNAAEVRAEIERARKLYAKADRLAGKRRGTDSDAAGKARDQGWEILRAVLESHPWRPRVVRKRRREDGECAA